MREDGQKGVFELGFEGVNMSSREERGEMFH